MTQDVPQEETTEQGEPDQADTANEAAEAVGTPENGQGEPAADASAETEDAAETAEPAEGDDAGDLLSSEPPKDHILDPAKLCVSRGPDGTARLEIEGDRCYMMVRAARLFPITRRRELISLSDGADEEIGLIQNLRQLPKPMRRIVLEELRKRYFVPLITRVNDLKDEYGVLYWSVETTRGSRDFVVRDVRDNIREFPGGKLEITDVDGNQFEILDFEALPGKNLSELYRLM